MYQLAASLWHDLSAAEQQDWERAGTTHHMTGFAYYMSQALRPNPGIYLPLAGGTMTGPIAMSANRITALADPIDPQDAATKKYHDDNLPPPGYGQGARVRRSTHQVIPHSIVTTVIFDTEDYDNDAMWEGVTNPHRLTIKTTGIYLITAQLQWFTNAAGYRGQLLWHSAASYLCQTHTQQATADNIWRGVVTTTFHCLAGHWLELRVVQTSGADLVCQSSLYQSPVLQAVRIG